MRTSLYSGRYAGGQDIHGLLPPALASLIRRFGRWQNSRAAARHLAGMPDEALRDIGLTRDGIDSAVRLGR